MQSAEQIVSSVLPYFSRNSISPDALSSFRVAIALAISAMVGISSRLVLVMHCRMLSRASWFMSPVMLSSFWKWSLHLATTLAVREGLHSIYWFQVNRSLLFGSPHFLQSIVEALHVVSVSSCIAFLSHQSNFSAWVRFCSSLQASLYAAVVDLVLQVCNTLVGLISSAHKIL